ncbi:MAG: terminase [Egibacteraceae bacterium]
MPTPSRRIKSTWQMSKEDLALLGEMAGYYADPYDFVLDVFPWGKGELSDHTGPDAWQAEVLRELGRRVALNTEQKPDGTWDMTLLADAIQMAVVSGHGTGKSALIAWIILWFMTTREHPQMPVTANTQHQLLTKTWRELSRWHQRAIHKHWFEWTATRFYHRHFPETWFAAAIPWSKQNSEAFAGTHEKHVLLIMDEGSAIPDIIWEVSDGAMSTAGAIRIVFGNGTRNNGRFRECFRKLKAYWWTKQVDSRTAKMTNKKKIAEDIEAHGEDSDFVRVRWRGLFPAQSETQFISSDVIFQAQACTLPEETYQDQPKVLSVDVARHGGCKTVITRRQGKKMWPQKKLRIPDLVQVSRHVAAEYDDFKPDVPIQVDATGMGWGVVDTLRSWDYPVGAVEVGTKADRDEQYHNRRSELCDKMKKWLDGADIPPDPELADELTSLAHRYDDKLRLELLSKDHMETVLDLPSPDDADSLMVGFNAPLVPTTDVSAKLAARRRKRERTGNPDRYHWKAGA